MRTKNLLRYLSSSLGKTVRACLRKWTAMLSSGLLHPGLFRPTWPFRFIPISPILSPVWAMIIWSWLRSALFSQGFMGRRTGKRKKFTGKQLEGIVCKHPLFERDSLVICGEHVTLEQGTGCVHTAPDTARTFLLSANSTVWEYSVRLTTRENSLRRFCLCGMKVGNADELSLKTSPRRAYCFTAAKLSTVIRIAGVVKTRLFSGQPNSGLPRSTASAKPLWRKLKSQMDSAWGRTGSTIW